MFCDGLVWQPTEERGVAGEERGVAGAVSLAGETGREDRLISASPPIAVERVASRYLEEVQLHLAPL